MEAYDIYESLNEFSAAREQFETIVRTLESEEMKGAEHGEVERYLFKDGYELLRILLQGYMDRRSGDEPLRKSARGSDGVVHTHRREGCTRQLETIFGEVTVRRIGYFYLGYESLFPLDAELNLL